MTNFTFREINAAIKAAKANGVELRLVKPDGSRIELIRPAESSQPPGSRPVDARAKGYL